jgi:LCP family protein required for cell wall assembly
MTRTPMQRRWRQAGIAFGTATCLMSMAAGTVFGHFYWNVDVFRQSVNKHGLQMVADAFTGDITREWTPDRQFSDRTSMNVLILGVDHDYDNRDQIIKTSPGRSDSIMIARVDFLNHTINALTIPRDTAVRIPGYRGIHKINAAHNLGGPQLTMDTIKEVFGIQADAYVTINFEGFQKIVDSIGGIDVNVEKKLDYDDNWGNLHIHLKPGYQHLDGYKAMGFVRMRHSDSDEMRSKRQHEFLEAMRNKIKSPSTIGSLPTMVNNLNDMLKRGNLTDDQLFTLANFARSIPKENINIQTLPSFEGPSYVTIYPEKSAKLIQELFFPNDMVALNIDAPDPNSVRSLNAPYERGGRRRSRGSRTEPKTPRATEETQPPASEPLDPGPVEPPKPEDDGRSTGPLPEGGHGGDDKGGGTGTRG